MNFSRLRLGIGFAVLLGIATATAGLAQYGSAPQTPAAVVAQVPTNTPSAQASAGPRRGRRAPGPAASGSPSPGPSDTPQPPQFTTLDGVWEVEMQPLGRRLAVYSHLNITTTGATITGSWQNGSKKTTTLPMTGTFDGRLISMTVTMPNGTSSTFSGYVETFADMVGLYRTSDKDPGMAFTAEHRKKLKS